METKGKGGNHNPGQAEAAKLERDDNQRRRRDVFTR